LRSTPRAGAILWRQTAGASVNAGAAVARGTVYWGSGYVRGGGSAGNKLYAFAPEETDS
jgi:polyvinyl alcohol dehydrogenase (cytochrome)